MTTRSRSLSEKLFNQQQSLLIQIEKSLLKYREITPDKRTSSSIKNRISSLQSKYDSFKENHVMIIDEDDETSKTYNDEDWMSRFEEIYINARSELEDDLYVLMPPAPHSDSLPDFQGIQNQTMNPTLLNTIPSQKVNLGKIQLPSFDGTYSNWSLFNSLYKSMIHENQSIDCIQKFYYLRSSLTGDALKIIGEVPLVAENYQEAYNLLCEKYENNCILFSKHMKSFSSLPIIKSEDAASLTQLLNVSKECICVLKSFGFELKHFEPILVYYLAEKLPHDTREFWVQSSGQKKDIPTFKEISDCIEIRVRTIEEMTPNKSNWEKSMKNCTSIRNCAECGNRHNTLLHNPAIHFPKQLPSSETSTSKISTYSDNAHANFHVKPTISSQSEVLLATIIVHVKSYDNTMHRFRALLDSGSQANLMTEQTAQTLKLLRSPIRANISGLASTSETKSRSSAVINIISPTSDELLLSVDAFILPKITSRLPTSKIPFQSWPHLEKLPLADPTFNSPGKIDILLGADSYAQIMMNGLRRGSRNDPIAQETKLGWVILGQVNFDKPKHIKISNFCLRSDIDSMFRKFLELESVTDKRILSPDEKWCESFYAETYRRNEEGRFIVRLPFKTYVDKSAVLGRSRLGAINRQLQLERKFIKNPELYSKYKEVMADYVQQGHMHRVSTTEQDHIENLTPNSISYNCNYIPHHAVIKEDSSTTKLRVVFDASKKTTNGNSLNDILFTGPALQNDVINVILNWRFHKVAFSADIAQMYRQIQLPQADAEFQRIIWRNNLDEPMQDYAINTVMFGGSCSPYLAIKTLHQLASDEQETFPLAAKVLLTDIYVDDIFSGGDDSRKWASNCPQILSSVPPEAREIQQLLSLNKNETVKALGIYWQPVEDNLSFSLKFDLTNLPKTKRSVMSVIARLYDPSGWISPIIVVAKIILKRLWFFKLDWDDEIPNELQNDWQNFLNGLKDLPSIRIPRWLKTMSTNHSFQLHAYCDASSNAYAAVVYLKTISSDGSIHVTLLTSKTKVSPVKPLSIPRLELCGALLLTKLLKHIKSGLNINISDKNIFAYTDSKIVLAWLNGDVNRWKVFVANRVSKILDTISVQQWHHIPTAQNPSDCATRGMYPNDLIDYKLWWEGPLILMQNDTEILNLNTTYDDVNDDEILAEVKTKYILTITVSDDFVERFSTFNKLIRLSVLCSRFAFNARQKEKSNRITKPISTEDIQIWTLYWIKVVQALSFPNDLEHLNSKKNFSHHRQFLTLNPEKNSDGIIVVGGRLEQSNLSTEQKHPIILPARHHFTNLIIRQAHSNTLHGGIQITLSLIRKKYWILNARNAVRAEINKCITCFRHNPKPCQQLLGNLPSSRVQFTRPFTHTGIDYAGPINIRPAKGRGITSRKGYICIFICFCTKAIHIEAVSDLSSQSFLAAFYRFVARRGYCSHIYSDNGTNFVGADKILKRNKLEFQKTVEKDLLPTLSNLNISWHFIPPASPNFGGLWEAGVKSIKYHLKRVIGTSTLTYEEISTLLCQIEAVLNSRPLCPLTNDPDDLEPLTPGHFLIGEQLFSPPESNLIDTTISPLNRFDLIQKMKQGFVKRWKKDYIGRLQSRPKWLKMERNVGINDLVIIKNDQIPSIQWQLGRIVAVHPGLDNVTVTQLNRVTKINASTKEVFLS
ncbi:uncharacterized protein LOC129909455 [Episyrphus balteatus]|uniref:uncharacterized protein LOC129909455 n=1 Tax=Episyrphus balteatus TaxID=286459 RepID=UPI00248542FE|nr:uncharacterized protein LOC129909455 [Episyrphus balteatus]